METLTKKPRKTFRDKLKALKPVVELNDTQKKSMFNIAEKIHAMKGVYDFFTRNKYASDYNNVVGRPKGEDGSEWGYIPTHFEMSYIIVELIEHFKIKKMLDMGAGAGFFLLAVRKVIQVVSSDKRFDFLNKYSVALDGIDNEEVFVKDAKLGFLTSIAEYAGTFNLKLKDLLKIQQDDLKGYDALFMYEPMARQELAKLFVEQLSKAVHKGQYIFYNQAGSIGHYMELNDKFKPVYRYRQIMVYRVL